MPGKTYVQQTPGGTVDRSEIGHEGDPVLIEALVIPGESVAGYPTVLVFSAQMAISPKSGQPTGLTITADQPYVMDKPQTTENAVTNPPTATIEQVELVYFVSNPQFTTTRMLDIPTFSPPGGSMGITATGMNSRFSSRRLSMNTCSPSWLHLFRAG